MRLHWAIALLPYIFSLSNGLQMSVWANTEGNIVFNSQTSVTNADEFSGTRFQALYNIAQANFDDVKLRSDAPTKDGNLLVAALWDPITSVVYASTIPRGEFIKSLILTC
ncbi:hypothetical protein BGZ57DRAFT_995819 [Hyaloscypha finlandica]|nr:hypothetical protein BGZ57DRAFT_995819 [Hyaloscypha finlandica]